jgi:hypothetical protein
MTNGIQYPHSRFVGCTECCVLHPVVHESTSLSGDARQAAAEGFNEFVAAHMSHGMTTLERQGNATRSDGPLWDPLASLTFHVTDGSQTFVVSATRGSIDEPRQYRFTPGRLAATPPRVTVEDDHVRRGLDRQFFPHAVRPSKIERFVGILRDVVSQIDADGLEIAFDDADDPAVSIARMPDDHYEELVTRCAHVFDASEMPHVSNFLAANRSEDGLLALRVRQEYRVLAA